MFTKMLYSSGGITPEQSGHFVGQLIFFILLLAGALKCWKISLRPTTNRKCALSLMFAFLSCLGFACVGVLLKMYDPSPTSRVISGIFGIGLIGLMILALVFAILGLIEYAKQPGAYVQGKSQAIWTLILAAFILCSAGWGFINTLRGAVVGGIPAKSATPGKVLDFAKYNFRFRSPDQPWHPIDLSKLNKASKVSFMRQFPESYFMIIAENLGSSSQFTTEQLAAIGKAHLESAATSIQLIHEAPLKVNDLDGLLVERNARVNNLQLFYVQWYLATNGYAYQLIGYGKTEDRNRVEGELRQMLSRFNLIDPNRMATSEAGAYTNNYVSPAHFYSVEVANSAWHPFATLKEQFPEGEFGGSQADSCFVVLPVWLGSQKIDSEALASGLLATMNIKYSDDDLTHRKAINENGGSGWQYDFKRVVDGTLFRYRFRILQAGEFAYFVAAWTQRNEESTDAILNDALARIKITAPPTTSSSNQSRFSGRDRKTRGYVMNQAGLFYYKSEEYEKALPLFRSSIAVDSTNTDYVYNLLLTLNQLDRSKEGLDYLNAQPQELLNKPAFLAFQALFQSECSLTGEAITNYAKAFSSGYRNEVDFKNYINLLVSQRQYDKALAEVDEYLKAGDSAGIRLLIGDIYRKKQDFGKAVQFYKDEHDKALFNSKVTRLLVLTLLDAGQPNEALAYCRELLKDDSSSYSAYYLEARCEMNLKWYREAKLALEAAAKLAPSNEDVKEDLAYVSGLLGEGNNSMLKTPIDPVLLPEAVTKRPAEMLPKDYAKEFGAYYFQSIKAISYNPHTEYKVTDYLVINVLDEAGVATFSTYQMAFDPLNEDVFVNEGRVLDNSGKILTTVKASDCYVIDDVSSGKASHKKILNMPIAGLQPGSQLSLVITRRSSGKLEEFPYFGQSFSRSLPVATAGVFLQGDPGRLKIRTTPGIQRENLKEGIYWIATNPMVARWEPLQPPGSTYLPMLWIADDNQRWTDLATNYLASINDRLQSDDHVRLKAEHLTGKINDNASKLAVLSRFVQSNCTYKAIEFGRRSRIPNRAVDTLQNSYGDCKDHAVLLQQLLKCTGIPANLTLVSTQKPIQPDMPSLDQFDHMIVEVQVDDQKTFVDCTDKGADLTVGVPAGFAERQVLVLDPANPHLTKIPAYPTNASFIEVQQHVRLLGTSDLSVDETMSLTGAYGAYLRDYLQGISPTYRLENLQRGMGMADTVMSHLAVESLDTPNLPLQLKFSFVIKNRFHQTQDGLVGMLRSGIERYYLSQDGTDHRSTPFEITIPLNLRSQVVFDHPKGYHLVEKPETTTKLNSRFITFQAEHKIVDGSFNLQYQFQQPVGRYAATDYSSYQESLTQIQASMDHEVVLQADGQ